MADRVSGRSRTLRIPQHADRGRCGGGPDDATLRLGLPPRTVCRALGSGGTGGNALEDYEGHLGMPLADEFASG